MLYICDPLEINCALAMEQEVEAKAFFTLGLYKTAQDSLGNHCHVSMKDIKILHSRILRGIESRKPNSKSKDFRWKANLGKSESNIQPGRQQKGCDQKIMVFPKAPGAALHCWGFLRGPSSACAQTLFAVPPACTEQHMSHGQRCFQAMPQGTDGTRMHKLAMS